MKMSFHSHVDKTHFHMKGFARGLALKKRHKTIWKWPIGRVPKGFRAPGPRAKNCRAPGLQDSTIGGLGLHGCTLELHLARIIIFVRAPRPWDPVLGWNQQRFLWNLHRYSITLWDGSTLTDIPNQNNIYFVLFASSAVGTSALK